MLAAHALRVGHEPLSGDKVMGGWRTLLGSVSALALLISPVQGQNYEYSPTYQPNLGAIGVTEALHDDVGAWLTDDLRNVAIAILDGRADDKHVDLSPHTTVILVYPGVYTKLDDHGTHVSGIAGAARNDVGIVGVNPFARLLSIPVFDNRGWVARDLGKAALDAAVFHGAKAANMSYGPVAKGDGFLDGELNLFKGYRDSLILVRAAGNDGVNLLNEYYSQITPTTKADGDFAHLLIVGSVNSNNQISSFSNRPGNACITWDTTKTSCAATDADAMMNFFIVAPGERIVSDLPRNKYGYGTGTSMAAPHVTGAAVLVYQFALAGNTLLSPADVANILKESATSLGSKTVYGVGLLNVEAALGPIGEPEVPVGDTVDDEAPTTSTSKGRKSSVVGKSNRLDGALSGMIVLDKYKRSFVLDEVNLPSLPSYRLEDALHQLVAGLSEHRQELRTSGGSTLSFMASGDAMGMDGYKVLSFASDTMAVQAGVGTAQTYFAAAASERAMQSGSYALASDFYAGSGDVGKGLGRAMFAGADYQLSDRLSASALFVQTDPRALEHGSDPIAQYHLDDADSSTLVQVGLRYQLKDWIALGASYGLLHEQGRVLGMDTGGALSLGEAAQTHLVGANIRARLSEQATVALFGQVAHTSSSLDEASLFSEVDGWRSSKFGLSFEWQSLLASSDMVRLTVARPWTLDSGKVSARVPVGRELDGTVNYENRKVSIAGAEFPLELSFGYLNRAGRLSYGAGLTMFTDDVAARTMPEVAVTTAFQWRF
jgi:hypothetical protein